MFPSVVGTISRRFLRRNLMEDWREEGTMGGRRRKKGREGGRKIGGEGRKEDRRWKKGTKRGRKKGREGRKEGKKGKEKRTARTMYS